jgi:hypothetical protein
METKILEILAYIIPSIITGAVAYYFFDLHTKNEENRRRYLLLKETQKDALPMRLQAYERMALYMERINPTNLLIRIKPVAEDKYLYENLVIGQIEQEFEHNLTQQIYMTDDCWMLITTAKNATIQMIRIATSRETIKTADDLRETIFKELNDRQSPSTSALAYIKNEVRNMW